MLPLEGTANPTAARARVLLPEPLSPTRPKASPGAIRSEDAIDRAQTSPAQPMRPDHHQIADFECRHAADVSHGRVQRAARAAGQQSRAVGVSWGGKDLRGRPGFDNPPSRITATCLRDALDHRKVVRHEQHGQPAPCLQTRQKRQDLGLHGGVQRGGRLVGDQQRGDRPRGPWRSSRAAAARRRADAGRPPPCPADPAIRPLQDRPSRAARPRTWAGCDAP